MKRILSLGLLACVVLPITVRAQQPKLGPLAAAMHGSLTTVSRNMTGAGDLMPAEKFGYKPTPEQMSFGEIIAHEAQSNETLCAAVGRTAAPTAMSGVDATSSKDQLVARLRKSFDFCGTVIAQMKEAGLGDSVTVFGGRRFTRARVMIILAQDWADHYAQAAIYLRLNGILPPSARPRP
jgi:hypothetical protein